MYYQKKLPLHLENVTKGMLEMIGFEFGKAKGKYIEANLPNGWRISCPWSDKYTSDLLYTGDDSYFVNDCNLIDENGYIRAQLTSNSKEVRMRFFSRYYIKNQINGPLLEDWDKKEYTTTFYFIDSLEKKAVYTISGTFTATKASYKFEAARMYNKLEGEMLKIIKSNFHNYENPLVYWGRKP